MTNPQANGQDRDVVKDAVYMIGVIALTRLAVLQEDGENLALGDARGLLIAMADLLVWSEPQADKDGDMEKGERVRLVATQQLMAALGIDEEAINAHMTACGIRDE